MALSERDKLLSADDQNKILAATDRYNNATTDAERNAAHAEVEAIRNNAGYTGGENGLQTSNIGTAPKASTSTASTPAKFDNNIDYSIILNNLMDNGGSVDDVRANLNSRMDKIASDSSYAQYANDATTQRALDYIAANQQKGFDPKTDAAYLNALAALQEASKNQPTYNPSYDGQILDIYNQIVNRPKFEYDLNSDMLYKQYRQQYVDLGRLAMRDTMGQAAALTGGYGSTYGQAVGQQQYDAYLQRLNDIIPELYDRAYGQYQDEGDQMMQQYGMLTDLRDNEYGRYSDDYDRWYNNRGYLQGVADNAWNQGLTLWDAEQDVAKDERNWNYQVEQDNYARSMDTRSEAQGRIDDYLKAGGKVADLDPQLIADSGYTEPELRTMEAYYANQLADASAGTRSSGTSSHSSGKSDTSSNGNLGEGDDNSGVDESAYIKELQRALGMPETGVWDTPTMQASLDEWGTTNIAEAWDEYSGYDPTEPDSYGIQTYSEAVAYLNNQGISKGSSGIKTENEWKRDKAGFRTYPEYLNWYISWRINNPDYAPEKIK